MPNQENTYSIDEYLRKSGNFLKFAKAHIKVEPEKTRQMITEQLSEHIKLLKKAL